MHNSEHIELLIKSVSIVAALHFAKGYMTGEYRNLMAVALVVVVLVVVNEILNKYEGADVDKNSVISRQVPVDLIKNGFPRSQLDLSKVLSINYGTVDFEYKHKHGHAGTYVPVKDDKYVTYNGTKYYLKQFHYHIPSENHVDGKKYDAEVHFVNVNPEYNSEVYSTDYQGMDVKSADSNQYLVIGLLFSKDNSDTQLFKAEFDDAFENHKSNITLDLSELSNLSYFNFPGSLTSNPFSSTITWFLGDDIIKTDLDLSDGPGKSFPRAHTARPTTRSIRDTALYFS